MKKLFLILCFLVLAVRLFGAFEDFQTGTRPNAMAGAFTALADDHNAPFWNPSGLSYVDSPEIFSTYKRLFGIISNFTFSSSIPSKWGNFAFCLRESSVKGDYTDAMGYVIKSNTTLEAERAMIVSHGFRIIEEVSFGYNLTGYQLQNIRFGDYLAFGVDIGMIMEVYRHWKIGFFYRNVNGPSIGDEFKHPLPEQISVGLSYSPFNNVITLLDFEKQLGYDINTKMGAEVEIIKNLLVLRSGVETEPVDFSIGFGSGFKHLRVNYAFRTHPELPFTHEMEAGWKF